MEYSIIYENDIYIYIYRYIYIYTRKLESKINFLTRQILVCYSIFDQIGSKPISRLYKTIFPTPRGCSSRRFKTKSASAKSS